MNVLILGSTSQGQRDAAALHAAVALIAGELARRGHPMVCLGDRPDTLTLAVVEGSAGIPGARVEVLVPDGGPPEFLKLEDGRPHVTVIRHPPGVDAEAVNLRALARSDGLIVIGGGLGTKTAGLAASLMNKAVIPVGGFGGGAERVWSTANGDRDAFFHAALTDRQVNELYSPWNAKEDPALIADCLEVVRAAIVRLQTPGTVLTFTILTLILSLSAWGLCLVTPSLVDSVSGGARTTKPLSLVLLLLVSACIGIAGAAVKILRDVRRGERVTTVSANIVLSLGFAVGVVTTLLYLITEISVTGKLELEKAHDDYARIALVMSVGALFAGLYLDAALDRLDGMRDSVLKGKEKPPPQ